MLTYRNARTIPGNSLYSSIVDKGKQVGIFGDSMIKRILGRRISKDLKYGQAKVRPFLGASASEVTHHIEPELRKYSYDAVVICAGTNNLPPTKLSNGDTFTTQSEDSIAQEIINVGYKCKDYGVNDVCISLLTVRKGYEEKVAKINRLLIDYCRAAHFYFIDHSNILVEHLYDGLHIDTQFIHLYANNISNIINVI